MAGYAVLFYHAVWGLYALLGRSRTGGEDFPQTRFAAWFAKAPGRASSLLIGAAWLPWVACSPAWLHGLGLTGRIAD